MNYLVVGAGGLLGLELVKEILSDDQNYVFTVTRKALNINHQRHQNIISDVKDFDFQRLRNSRIDVIYYVAQSNNFRDFPKNTIDVFDVNIKAPLEFINWATQNKVKSFIYTSSGGIYDEDIKLHEEANIKVENNLGFYLNSKLCAEIMLSNYKELFEGLIILRPFFIYGKRQKAGMLIPRLISMIKNESQISIDGESGIRLNPIYVEDAAKATYRASQLMGYHKINLAGKEEFTLREVLVLISESLNKKLQLHTKNTKPRNLVGDITKMRTNLHDPIVNFKEGISHLINSIK